MPDSMCDAVGNWQGGDSSRPLTDSMPVRYNGDRVLMAADIKARLLLAVSQKARKSGSADISWDAFRSCYTWETMSQWQLPTFQVQASSSADIPPAPTASQAEELSGSSSSSDSSDSDFDDEVQWFKQSRNGKVHLVQDVLASSLVPGGKYKKKFFGCRKIVRRGGNSLYQGS